MRLLSFSSASSPQAPVLTASKGRCILPSAVVLHSEACFTRQKRPREKNSTPPEMAPTEGQQIATGLTSPCPARAEHGPFYGTQGRQQLTAYATEPNISRFKVQTSKNRCERIARVTIAQRTRMRCRRLQNATFCDSKPRQLPSR